MPKTSTAQVSDVPSKMPSTLTLTEDDLPEVKDWQVGKTYKVTLEIKQVSADAGGQDIYGPTGSPKSPHRARFTILSASVDGGSPKADTMGKDGTRQKVMSAMSKKANQY